MRHGSSPSSRIIYRSIPTLTSASRRLSRGSSLTSSAPAWRVRLRSRHSLRSSSAAFAVFAALLNVGDTYNWVNYNTGPVDISWFKIGIFLAVFVGQVSVAAGCLALLAATRLARIPVISAAEARNLRRRAAVAWVSGAITVTLLALMALVVPTAYQANWEVAVLIAAGACGAALLTALPSIVRAAWVKPAAAGATPDLLEELTPFLPACTTRLLTPWRCAFVLATASAAALVAVGIFNDELFTGVLRGVAEGVLCLAGFSLLGRFLGMVRPAPELHAE